VSCVRSQANQKEESSPCDSLQKQVPNANPTHTTVIDDAHFSSDSKEALEMVCSSMKVHDDFITKEEEISMFEELKPVLQRLIYERDHWDNAIEGYRETERANWSSQNQAIIDRIRSFAFDEGANHINTVHILDLKKNGFIKPHIDSVRFCGDTIAGISLLSTSVMRLVHEDNKNLMVDVLLRQRSLYVMKGMARYKFTHEILKEEESRFKGEIIPRRRRISVICRNSPNDEKTDGYLQS